MIVQTYKNGNDQCRLPTFSSGRSVSLRSRLSLRNLTIAAPFTICAQTALRETFPRMKPTLLEPVMRLEIECPSQFQGNVVGDLNSRRGLITVTETLGATTRIEGEI